MSNREARIDLAVAVVVFTVVVAMLSARGFGTPEADVRKLDALGLLLAAATSLPLAARRRVPLTVFATAAASDLGLIALGYALDLPLATMIAAYGVAVAYSGDPRRAHRRSSMIAVAAFVPLLTAAYGVHGTDLAGIAAELGSLMIVFAALWIAGDRTRLRRAHVAELQERARRNEREAERERRLAAAEERTRIARELHDSAGHAINVILVQAGAARLLHEQDPHGSRRAIATIEEVARDTIGEIDRLVSAFREDDGTGTPAPPEPASLTALVARHRAAGLTICTDVQGTQPPLPRSVAWVASRILQEALTNAARHGDGHANVTLRFDPGAVQITVINATGAHRARDGGGHGIAGMLERATVLGGTLEAGDGGGTFRVHARLPCPVART